MRIYWLLVVFLLSGCNSLKLDNAIKTTATTGIVYLVGGAIPAAANMATSMALDEVMEDAPTSAEIEKGNNQQLAGFLAEKTIDGIVWIIISFLIITNLITPFIFRWFGIKRERKDQNFREMEVKK